MYCPFNARIPVFTKVSPGKVKESAAILDHEHVSGTTTKERQVTKCHILLIDVFM